MSPLDALLHLLARLPGGWLEGTGAGCGALAGSLFRYRRTEVLDAMATAFPEWSTTERDQTVDRMYRNLGRTAGEAIRLFCGRATWFPASVEVTNSEIVHEMLARGRGALFLSAHLGNFELCGPKAAAMGYPVHIVAKELRSPMANRFLVAARGRYGVGVIPRRKSFRDCLRALKRNELIGFMLDQNMIRDEGVFVDFLGRPASTTPGLAYLSAQSGAPVIPMFCRRVDGGHRMEMGQPFEPPPDREPDTIREMTQRYTRAVENAIRATPDQWIWIHRRWRTRPLAYGKDGDTGARI